MSSDPTVTSNSLYSLWKRQLLKFDFFPLQWSKFIPINLTGTLKTFNRKFEGFYLPHSSQMWRNCHFWTKPAIWDLKRVMGSADHVQFLFKLYNNFFFDHGKNKVHIFKFCLFHRLYRGSGVTGGLKTNFNFLKGIFCSGGVRELFLTMVNLKLKPSLFTPHSSNHLEKSKSQKTNDQVNINFFESSISEIEIVKSVPWYLNYYISCSITW